MSLAPDDPRHGTHNGYQNHGCRCGACREAGSNYHRDRVVKPCVRGCGRTAWHEDGREGVCVKCRAAERRTDVHGTPAVYKRGCRCDVCRKGEADRRRRHRHANIEASRAYERARWHRRRARLEGREP